MNEIAIASVPMQEWEQPYEPAKALEQGTIFPCLYKPFFITEQMESLKVPPADEREAMLHEIQKTSFALIDITMYLDTHPGDQEALAFRETNRLKRKELLQQFAAQYAPLTADCGGFKADGPIPWEGAC